MKKIFWYVQRRMGRKSKGNTKVNNKTSREDRKTREKLQRHPENKHKQQ